MFKSMKNKCDAILHTVHLICLLSAMYNGRKNMKVNIIYVSLHTFKQKFSNQESQLILRANMKTYPPNPVSD